MHKRILVRLQVGNAKGTELPSVGETTKDLKAQDNDVRRGAVGRGGRGSAGTLLLHIAFPLPTEVHF